VLLRAGQLCLTVLAPSVLPLLSPAGGVCVCKEQMRLTVCCSQDCVCVEQGCSFLERLGSAAPGLGWCWASGSAFVRCQQTPHSWSVVRGVVSVPCASVCVLTASPRWWPGEEEANNHCTPQQLWCHSHSSHLCPHVSAVTRVNHHTLKCVHTHVLQP